MTYEREYPQARGVFQGRKLPIQKRVKRKNRSKLVEKTSRRDLSSSSLDPHPLRVLLPRRELLANSELERLDFESSEVKVDESVVASETSSSRDERGSDRPLEDVGESSGDDVKTSTASEGNERKSRSQ